jgi:alkylation response protein AidB-like acyl-CoA dehydrogenase
VTAIAPPSVAERELIDARLRELLSKWPPEATSPVEFWRAQYELGLAWVRYPVGDGGLGLGHRWQSYINSRILAAGGSDKNRYTNMIGIVMASATLQRYAAAELRARLLPRIFTTEDIWCQLFSEPGAGSDLAGVATAAVRDGDSWIVNGQKVWTTMAHLATWALLLVRTDPDVPKHRGLSFLLLKMDTPGVEVRPLVQMTGEAEFNEVFLDNVCIPDSMRLGEVGRGWDVAITTLMNERFGAGREVGDRGEGMIARLVAEWAQRDIDDPVKRDRVTELWIKSEAWRLTELRGRAALTSGNAPGPEASVAKLMWSELNQAISTFALHLKGESSTLYPEGYTFERAESIETITGSPQKVFLRSRANTIAGGTSEIIRNLLSERVLGLPPEPRVDRDVPWRKVPRG